MNNETHIVSLIIYCRPEFISKVIDKTKDLPNSECHSIQDSHKLVLIFEVNSEFALSSSIDEINNWQGVLSVQLCYHHCEPNESLQEEIQYAIHTS